MNTGERTALKKKIATLNRLSATKIASLTESFANSLTHKPEVLALCHRIYEFRQHTLFSAVSLVER